MVGGALYTLLRGRVRRYWAAFEKVRGSEGPRRRCLFVEELALIFVADVVKINQKINSVDFLHYFTFTLRKRVLV